MAQGESSAAGEARRQAEGAARRARPWLERLARFGYAAKGVVYAVIGFLALRQALGLGGKTTGTSGAVQSAAGWPLGGVLLVVLAVGLVGYAIWKLTQAIADAEDKGSDAKGIARRIGYAGSGVIHGGLAFTAAQVIVGSGGGGSSSRDWTARVLGYQPPLGQILVALVGLGVIGVCVYQLHAAYTAKFRRELKLGEMSAAEERFTTRVGRFGTAARGLVIGVAGVFVVLAAYHSEPSETRGLGGALRALSRQPFGPYLLGAAALGLLAYAVFMFIVARYRRIDPD
jgi:hypothetical protein